MMKRILLCISGALCLLLAGISSPRADIAESPDFIYCDTESTQPGAQPLPPQIKNQFRFGGAYFDQDLNQNVGIPGDRYFQDEPMSYVDGYSGPTAWNEYKFYAAPLDIDARLAMSAHSTLGQSGATGFGHAAKWFILTGTSEPVSIRADVAFQGKMFGGYDDPNMDGRAYFTHGATILRYPTSGTAARVAILNGACVPSWDVCGPFGLAGTIPDFCFTCDGIEHPFNKIIRGNPKSILPDIPFSILVFLNATASVSVPEGVTGEVNAYSNWHDPCLATSEKFYDWRLTREGIIVDRDGEFATHDEIRIGDAGYKLHTMADTSTRFQLAETTRTTETFNDDLMIKTASLDGTVAGAISGTLDIPELQLVLIDSGDYSGKGFFKGNFSAVLAGVVYNGDWKGMSYFSDTDQKVYLKGRLSGKISGTTDGYLEETLAGSGVYDRLSCTISLGEVLNQPTSAILDLSGELNYLGQTPYPGCDLELIQSVSSGEASGETSGTLHLTVTQMRITEPGNPFQGDGYSVISYASPAGSGEGWTYDTVPFTNVHYMRGQLSGAFNGAISLVLDDDRDAHYLAGTIRRVDLGMPPTSDLWVSGWSEWMVSPGDLTYYSVEYYNAGINTADNVKVIVRIAPGMEYVSCSAGGIYDPNSNEITYNVGVVKGWGNKYVILRPVWGLSDRFLFTNEAYIYTDSPEKNVALDAQHTVMTDEWNQFQYAKGNDYDVRL
ncbi:MAG: hypothetical protein Q7U02_09555, partial [Desulfosalsimonadaceae bacterium]|nr:hypothetical protein [Desulfosalsimonadaceae bacterium]